MFWIHMVSVCKNPIDELGEVDTWHLPVAPERSEEIHMKGNRIAALGPHLKGVTSSGHEPFSSPEQNRSNRFADGQSAKYNQKQRAAVVQWQNGTSQALDVGFMPRPLSHHN